MRKSQKLFLFLLAIFFVKAGFAAPTVHFGPTPNWVVQTALTSQEPDLRKINDGYYLKLYEREINTSTDEVYERVIKHIVSDAGMQSVSNLSINFNPAYEQLTIHKITVWRDGKPIDKLQKEALKIIANETDISMFIYNGNYTAYLILNDIRKGDEVEYSYTTSGSNPVFNKKFFATFMMQGTDPVGQLHYKILTPKTRVPKFKYHNNAEKAISSEQGGLVIYEWNILNVKGIDNNDNSPSWFNPFSYVQASEYKDWKEVGEWANTINQCPKVLGGRICKRVDDLKKQYDTDKVKLLRALVEIVQNEVRYMGVEIGPYSHKANKPEKVYDQRYGDCKDKSLLLVAMLRHVGIAAKMVLANTVKKDKNIDNLPAPTCFNHAIVQVMFGFSSVWIDPTISYQGGTGIDFYCPYYGKVLVLDSSTNDLTTMPERPAGEVVYNERYEINDFAKPASLMVNTVYSRSKADNIRSTFASLSKADLEKNFLDYYMKIYPHIKFQDTVLVIDNLNANIVETKESYTIDKFAQYDSATNKYEFSFYATTIKNAMPVIGANKKYPVGVMYPYCQNYTIQVVVPKKWNITNEKYDISRDAYHFSYEMFAEDSILTIKYKLSYEKDHISPQEIEQYEKDYETITNKYLSISLNYRIGAPAAVKTSINYTALVMFILTILCTVYGCVWMYRIKTERSISANHEPKPIGGWLILSSVGLIGSCASTMYSIPSSGFFSLGVWHAYDAQSVEWQYKTLLTLEILYNATIIPYTVFCIILFFKKRDILPRAIKVLYTTWVVAVVVDSLCTNAILPSVQINYNNIFRNIIAACVWIPYFNKAVRVRETFVVAYPDKGYEMPDYITQSTQADSNEKELLLSDDVGPKKILDENSNDG